MSKLAGEACYIVAQHSRGCLEKCFNQMLSRVPALCITYYVRTESVSNLFLNDQCDQLCNKLKKVLAEKHSIYELEKLYRRAGMCFGRMSCARVSA